jgi:GH15 family glucan-1,4-alpha-glucosidase
MDLKEKSIEIIVNNQHESGAFVASPNFETYNYSWMRDGSFIANSLDIVVKTENSRRFFDWVHKVVIKQEEKVNSLINKKLAKEPIRATDYLPTRYNLDGSETGDEWPNFQLDGYGTWLWALCQHIKKTNTEELIDKYEKSIKITLDYLLNFWYVPNYDCWEENGDKVHPSTLACIYGGLKSITEYVEDSRIDEVLRDIKTFVSDRCVVDNRISKYQGSNSIDSSLLWVAIPFGLFDINDEIFKNTVKVIEERLLHDGGVHRYPEDTYYGGGEWLLLSSWLGIYYAERGNLSDAKNILMWVEDKANERGEMTEQVLHHVNDEKYIEHWKEKWGEVANPLLWSHAMYLVLVDKIEGKKKKSF